MVAGFINHHFFLVGGGSSELQHCQYSLIRMPQKGVFVTFIHAVVSADCQRNRSEITLNK